MMLSGSLAEPVYYNHSFVFPVHPSAPILLSLSGQISGDN